MKSAVYVVTGRGPAQSVWEALRSRLDSYPTEGLALILSRGGYGHLATQWAHLRGVRSVVCDSPDLAAEIVASLPACGYAPRAEIVSPGDDERALAKRLEQEGIRVTVTEVG